MRLQSTGQQKISKISFVVVLLLWLLGAIATLPYGWQQSLLFVIGGLLGISLYHARFGFTSAYRQWWVERDGRGLLAQFWMLALATLLFAPVLALGQIGDQAIRGAIAPVGVAGIIGAFIFGIGMQLGGGCGCGSLTAFGAGNLQLLITLITFGVGSFLASLHRPFWFGLPSIDPIIFHESLGWIGGVALQLGCLGVMAVGIYYFQRPSSPPKTIDLPWFTRLIHGPWPFVWGASALAILAWLTLIFSGQPWRITWGFVIWSGHIAQALGWQLNQYPFWSSGPAANALNESIWADVSSVMNVGLILGAFLAAILGNQLIPTLSTFRANPIKPSDIVARLSGGFLMGYGALLAFGCNISAYFGGVASLSLHGWIWFLSAFIGSWFGLRLRTWLKI